MLYVIVNPTAGSGRAKKLMPQIESHLKEKGLSYMIKETSCRGDATRLAGDAVDMGAETVLSVGGDGTAYEVACALNGTRTALGIIPAGTGNDFIKTLGTPGDPMKALDHVLASPARPTDTGLLGDQLFLNEIGTGFDAEALRVATRAKKYCRGLLPYLIGVISAIFTFKPVPITYQADDGETFTTEAMVVGVANGGIIGGGIPVAPEASVDDGLFDVIVVSKANKFRLICLLPGLLMGKILTFPETKFFRARKVKFSTPGTMLLNIDGELKYMDSVSLSVSPGTLLVHR